MIEAWRQTTPGALPFAPPIDGWTEDHYNIYTMVELVLGNRKEVTPEEQEELEFVAEVDAIIESGDPDWLAKVEAYLDGGGDLDHLDQDLFKEIDAEQRARGE